MPRIAEGIQQMKGDVDKAAVCFDDIDMLKISRSVVLLKLQQINGDLPNLLDRLTKLDQELSSILSDIRDRTPTPDPAHSQSHPRPHFLPASLLRDYGSLAVFPPIQ